MSKQAVALRDFTHDDRSFTKGELIKNLPTNQFADWSKEGVDLVRAATDKDLGREVAPTKPKARSKPAAKPAKAKPASAPTANNSAGPAPTEPISAETPG